MKRRLLLTGLLLLTASACAEPSASAVDTFNLYIAALESRLARQHRTPETFLAPTTSEPRGGSIVERVAGESPQGALLHHWRGTAFAPGATAADFERLLRNFGDYPKTFAPQVVQASVSQRQGDQMQASMRVRQKHVITVVMDTAYDITFGRLDAQHGYSASRSTKISEIGPGGSAVAVGEEHGFLWRQNTYWSYEERDGGLYLQIESVSLSRSIPTGLGWAVRPFVESVPRESLEFTLQAVCKGLRK
jgi:hypothetical protein